MATWSPGQIGQIWVRNGGYLPAMNTAIAVALAESGGNDQAVSSSDDWGLWQINGVHAGAWPGAPHAWLDPDTNARAAIAISSNGADWGPWCTAWADPYDNCGHYLGPYLQAGSPASDRLGTFTPTTTVTPDTGAQGPEGANQHQLRAQWDLLTYTYTNNAVSNSNYQHSAAAALQRLIQSTQIPR